MTRSTSSSSSFPDNVSAIGSPPLWLALLAIWLVVGVTMGRLQAMGLYLPPVTTSLGVGRETFGFALALAPLLMGLGAPFSGAMIDAFGAGRVIAVCLLAAVAGLYALEVATSTIWLVASGILLGIGATGTGLAPLVGTIGRLAPPEKRLSAMASVAMAGGIGGFVALPVMHGLIEWTGWRGSLIWLIGITLFLLPCAWVFGSRPLPKATGSVQQTARQALSEAFRHPSFWLLTVGFFVCGFHVGFVITHLPAFTVDQGLPSWVGPYALSALGIANILGTWLAGQSTAYLEKRRCLSLIYFCRSLAFLAFLFVPITPLTVIVLCTILGVLWLATVPLTSGLVATFFGTAWMSMLFGIVFMSHQIGQFIGMWLGGRLFDAMRSYEAMWWISIALGLASALIHWPIVEKPVERTAAPAHG